MFFKKIPPINIVLFCIMLGIVAAATVGVIKFIKEQDDPYNNYVKSTYNSALSKHYTDSLSQTPLAALGALEIQIYDSVENSNKPYVLCSISWARNSKLSLNEAKNKALPALMTMFPNETWNGEFKYTTKEINRIRWITMRISSNTLEREIEWSED
jgi:hypothetical protein